MQQRNSYYDTSFREDLAEVTNSIGRILNFRKYSGEEFRFEKPSYNVTTTTDFIGLLTAFKLVTALKNTVQYGLLTDDGYVNQVFRLGPTTGLLYSDTKLKKGIYKFEVTADIIDLQLHATANVTVNVTLPSPKTTSTFYKAYPLLYSNTKLYPFNSIEEEPDSSLTTSQQHKDTTENDAGFFSYIPFEFSRNVDEDSRPFRSLWRGIIQHNSRFNGISSDEELLEKQLDPQSKIESILGLPDDRFRFQRFIPPEAFAASVDETIPSTSVASIKIHEESLLVDGAMSSFILFVTTFGVVILLGSLVYFIYKRIKKCEDYSVEYDDNIKYVDRPIKKEIILRSDLKSPNFLCVSEINQKRVTDSIEITKSKLQNHTPSVFTIQKCYEDQKAAAAAAQDDEDMFIVDVTQMSSHSQDSSVYNTITLQSFTNNTPAITATLIGAPPPVSILSSSRRSSIVSMRKDGQSMGSEEMGPNGEMRRKSVTFSDIVELYQIKGA
ncbi:uncharacterized protein LOC111049105 isoform X2 [Nilaparvata lugens]|nr:uncharacterized protein LOC111049105 isoform X2 [Nilaparvata lugens]